MDINGILNRIPHRYPFLLIDRVLELEPKKRIVTLKNVTINEPFFPGHFPGAPVMPGVLIVEAMAQSGAVLILNDIPDREKRLVYFTGIDKARFRRAVVPGDQIRMEAFTLRLSGGRGRVRCRSTVDGQLVSEARLNFALTEPPS